MKNLYVVLIVLLVFPFGGFSQGENDNWYFGDQAAIDFSSSTPVSINGSQMTSFEGVASVSDASGNLLFYSDGRKIWNANNQIMPNGNGLTSTDDASQGVVIVPFPGHPNQYFVFTTNGGIPEPGETSYDYIAYSKINMTADNGLGDVVLKNVPLEDPNGNIPWQNGQHIEAITVVNNNNGYWILVPYKYTLLAYKVDNTGINITPVQSTINYVSYLTTQIKVSPDKTLLAITEFSPQQQTTLYNFDVNSGQIQGQSVIIFQITNNNNYLGIYSTEFSSQSNIIWLSIYGYQSQIRGYDLNDLNTSPTIFYPPSQGVFQGLFGTIQRRPDGNIYVAVESHDYLGKISNSNSLANSAYFPNDIFLGGNDSRLGLPQLIIIELNPCQGQYIILSNPETNSTFTYQYSDYIVTNQNYNISNNQNIALKAGNYIQMQPDTFWDSSQGASVLAKIEACDASSPLPKRIIDKNYSTKIINISIEEEKTLSLNVYPNPVNTILHIDIPKTMRINSVVIIDVYGKPTQMSINENHTLDMSNITSGIYILKLETSQGTFTKRVIKE